MVIVTSFFNYYLIIYILMTLFLHFTIILLDVKTENKKLKAQNDDLWLQLDELNEKFKVISLNYKSLQENNELLMGINQEFSHENN